MLDKKGSDMTTQTATYMLDNRNIIISIDGMWDEFAAENGGTKLSSKDVCGRPIWNYIDGDVTRMWLEVFFQYLISLPLSRRL